MTRRVAVAGATGAVGQDLRRLLETRSFPLDDVVFLASERSAGRKLSFAGQEVEVRPITEPTAFTDVDVALFSAGGAT